MGITEDDKSSKPVDTSLVSNLEQEPVIASGKTTCHTGKSSALAEWQSSLVYERRNSLRCNDWNYAVKVRAKLKGKKAGVFDGPLLNGVNMASIHASIPSIIDYWKAAPMYAECF